MKKSFSVFSLLLLCLLLTAFLPYKNIPVEHETRGKLVDPIEVGPGETVGPLWTFLDTTGCVSKFEITLTLADSLNFVDTSNVNPNYTFLIGSVQNQIGQLDISEIRAVTGLYGTFWNTHASVHVFVNGIANPFELYPNIPRTITTTADHPCDCLHLVMDETTRTILVTFGVGC